MKGRNHFSEAEAESIRSTLRRVRKSDRSEQKRLRDTLRNDLGFYISDFTPSTRGFTAEDFQASIDSGRIRIR